MALLDNYTAEQLAAIKEASYKIADAAQMFRQLTEQMAANHQWRGLGDINHIACILEERMTGPEGCLQPFLAKL